MSQQDTQDMSFRVQRVIDEFGNAPLGKSPLANEYLTNTPEIVLAMVMDAMVKSKPISHGLSEKTINHLLETGYHDINKLHKSTWEERTMVLQEGGYNRYREQTATNLGNLAEFVVNEYSMSQIRCL